MEGTASLHIRTKGFTSSSAQTRSSEPADPLRLSPLHHGGQGSGEDSCSRRRLSASFPHPLYSQSCMCKDVPLHSALNHAGGDGASGGETRVSCGGSSANAMFDNDCAPTRRSIGSRPLTVHRDTARTHGAMPSPPPPVPADSDVPELTPAHPRHQHAHSLQTEMGSKEAL